MVRRYHRTWGAFALLAAGLCWAKPLAAQCGAWSPLVNLSNDTGRFAVDGSLAVDAAGKVHLIYQDFLDASGANLYTTNASGSWSAPLVLQTTNGKSSAPRAVITPDQQLHLFYGKNTLYHRTKPVSGGSWSDPQQVSISPDNGFIQGVTVDSSGGIYFMYGHLFDNAAPARNGIYGRYKPFGGAWGTTELIYGNNQDNNWPNGDQIIAQGTTLWVTIAVDDKMYFKKKPAAGAWPAGKGTQFNESGGGLRFAFDPTSNEIAAFWGQSLPCSDPCEDDPWIEVYVKYSYNDGASWSGTYNISGMLNDIDRLASGVYDANGNLHVVWEGFCCDHKVRMRYRGRVGGVWGPIQQLSSLPGGAVADSLVARGLNLYFTFSNTGTGIGLYDVVYTQIQADQPRVTLNCGSINHSIYVGTSLSAETFTITNGCAGTLNYTITSDVAWLSISPTAGSAASDVDTVNITYASAGLHRGVHNGTITVAGNAWNNPQTIPVKIAVSSVRPDFDGDGDVDQTDFGHLQSCLSGASVHQTDPTCQDAKLDGDEDVDQNDFGVIQRCFSGAGVIPSADCAG